MCVCMYVSLVTSNVLRVSEKKIYIKSKKKKNQSRPRDHAPGFSRPANPVGRAR